MDLKISEKYFSEVHKAHDQTTELKQIRTELKN